MKKDIFEYEKKKAIAILVSLGAAKYVRDLDLYHGRAGDGGHWEVSPAFNNGSNNTGNHNVYSVSGLYSGDYETAKEFAEKRVARGNGSVAEVHKIVSINKDAIIFDFSFDKSKLTEEEKNMYYSALNTLCSFGISEALPIKY